MSDPITVIILALQSIFAPTPAVAALPAPPATITIAPIRETPSWAPPLSWSLPKLSCSLEHKGTGFVAVVVADVAKTVGYDLQLTSSGSNRLNFKVGGKQFDLHSGSNHFDLDSSVKISGQMIDGTLTLHPADRAGVSCSTK